MRCALIFLLLYSNAFSQGRTDSLLLQVLSANKNVIVQKVLSNPMEYRLQVIYTQINRDKYNNPTFISYYYNYDPNLYFNPASMVKLPAALLALGKLNELDKRKVNKYTTLLFDSSYPRQTIRLIDTTSKNGLPSIAHFIKKAFLVSDNDAYNRLFQFLGQQYINRNLKQKGYPNSRIIRQFRGFTQQQNRHTNQVRFINRNGRLLYLQPAQYNTDSISFNRDIKLGNAHYNSNDSLISQPFDFTAHNNLPLEEMQQMLLSVMEPGSVPGKQRFNLSRDDRKFLMKFLSQYPSETSYPKYDTSKYYDSYVKFFFRNSSRKIPGHIRVFNKVGWSYGFVTDVSYIVDFKNKVEFMLAATIYVNRDEILNDNRYEYNEIGYPFLYELGQTIYQYELKRDRQYTPDLKKFKIKYEKRNEDSRKAIREVDN